MAWRPKFDPAAQSFVARRRFKMAGIAFKGGDLVDASLLPHHKLRRLFENRMIVQTARPDLATAPSPIQRDVPPVYAIESAGSWKYVTRNGERIGKGTQDREEAERALAELKSGAPVPSDT